MACCTLFEGLALRERYRRLYSAEPRVFRAPGSVSLMGEDTPCNGGFLLAAAIGLWTRVIAHPSQTNRFNAHLETPRRHEIANLDDAAPAGWSEPLRDIVAVLRRRGCAPRGAHLMVDDDFPDGPGLGASASLEVAAMFALLGASGAELSRLEIANLCQRAERLRGDSFSTAPFISCHGREGHAVFLDCRSLEYHHVPIPDRVSILICHTGVRHREIAGLAARNRAEYEEGMQVLTSCMPAAAGFRDVTPAQLASHRNLFEESVYRRCRHLVEENERVTKAGMALLDNDLRTAGALMNESHESMRLNCGAGCTEVDLLARLARECRGVWGARMGGPAGRCLVCLVDVERAGAIARAITHGYRAQTGIQCETWLCRAAEGAGEEMF
ncbi:MAG TPA: galactokinase family protein [Bryobacteraceae bacterium]|nr:galactokinase family protein [Bryobacteraceae bacterium]